MCFSAAASSENDQGSMNLASKTAPLPDDDAVKGGAHPPEYGMPQAMLDVIRRFVRCCARTSVG